ncbi:MAG TPA: hypothetical protein VGP92_03385 [Acidimicrobiia bacterium]|nr:hypothetical protein [Acidimicrobiia bacterium]
MAVAIVLALTLVVVAFALSSNQIRSERRRSQIVEFPGARSLASERATEAKIYFLDTYRREVARARRVDHSQPA